VQPRISGEQIKSWNTTVERLAEFEDEFREAARLASTPDAPLVTGQHCQFCPAAGFCPALRRKSLDIAMIEFEDDMAVMPRVEKMTPAALGRAMMEIEVVEAWCSSVREHALMSALDGNMPEGFKLVSKKTNRRWVDEDKAAGALRSLYELEDAAIYVRKLVSPAQAEKLVGKSSAKSLESLTTRPPGGATLAPLSDKRKAITPDDAKSEFGD
jgi:hypothetical protein